MSSTPFVAMLCPECKQFVTLPLGEKLECGCGVTLSLGLIIKHSNEDCDDYEEVADLCVPRGGRRGRAYPAGHCCPD